MVNERTVTKKWTVVLRQRAQRKGTHTECHEQCHNLQIKVEIYLNFPEISRCCVVCSRPGGGTLPLQQGVQNGETQGASVRCQPPAGKLWIFYFQMDLQSQWCQTISPNMENIFTSYGGQTVDIENDALLPIKYCILSLKIFRFYCLKHFQFSLIFNVIQIFLSVTLILYEP